MKIRKNTGANCVVEPLESRRLLSAQTIVAVLDATASSWSPTRRSVAFYDITELNANTFGQPLFSVWTGYEDRIASNFEDIEALTVNPFNGDVYVLGFDSGPAGVADTVGDTQGDFDLYRLDFQKVYAHWTANGSVRGRMYAPTVGPDGSTIVQHPAHGSNTINLAGASTKVGEIARAQDGPFFDVALEFVDPETLLLLDNQTGLDDDDSDPSNANPLDTPENDHQIRLIQRVSTSAGSASYDTTLNEGGFNRPASKPNAQVAESWVSTILTRPNLDRDANGVAVGRSEPVDMAYVNRDGVQGVWVGESDGGGDDIAFFEFTPSSGTYGTAGYVRGSMTLKEQQVGGGPDLPTSFALDENPVVDASTNDGELDWLAVDGAGNLVIGESGFFDTPQHEPRIIRRDIGSYAAADSNGNGSTEIEFGGWSVSQMPVPATDDDTAVTDGRFGVVDKRSGNIVLFDPDSGAVPDVTTDAYVFSPSTNAFVLESKNGANHFTERQGNAIFTIGDATNDGLVTAEDIDRLHAVIRDPANARPGATAALVGEWFDLTGDNLATVGVYENSDVDFLVHNILGTEYGDADLDGVVNDTDVDYLLAFFGGTSGRWSEADFNGDGVTDDSDVDYLLAFFGTGA